MSRIIMDKPLLAASALHALGVAGLLGWVFFAPKPAPVVAVFELVSMERPKLRPLAPKTPEPPAEQPAESRPPEAPTLAPKAIPNKAPVKPEPKNTQPVAADPSLPVKDVARENTSHNLTISDVPTNPMLAWWAGRVKRNVETQWNPPAGIEVAGTAKTVISFQVDRSGKIKAVEVAQSSGNGLLDDFAKRTIERIQKVAPIPDNFSGDLLKVSYEFIYNGD